MADDAFDRLDLQILAALQESNQTSAQDLAERIPLSASAILRRIRGYRESGVIAADVSVLEPTAVGDRISVLLHIQLERHAQASVGEFRAHLTAAKEVQAFLEITGTYDIACIAVFRSMEEFNRFADAKIADHPAVRRYEASFIKKRVKFSTALPL